MQQLVGSSGSTMLGGPFKDDDDVEQYPEPLRKLALLTTRNIL